MKHHILDKTFWVYTAIAVACWCVGTGLMFLLMVVCYFVSYSLAPVVTKFVLDHWTLHAKGNVSLAVGSVTFTILNYFGQRYVVFRSFHQKKA